MNVVEPEFVLSNKYIKKYAKKFVTPISNLCLDNKKSPSIVDKDSQEGSTYGVSGNPTFYIEIDQNRYTEVVGAHPFSTFQQKIDQR
jgi:protein-disulfide isomerase